MTDKDSRSLTDLTRDAGAASGRHPGMKQPNDTNGLDDRLGGVDSALRGLTADDDLRDKRGNGVSGDYDDSVDHSAEERYRGPNAAERPVDRRP